MLSHTNLHVYYKNIFALAQHYKYSIEEIENLLPFERDIYTDLLIQFIEKQKEKANK